MVKEAALEGLRAGFRGDLLTPTDAGYVFHLNANVRPTR